jgi:hypothetical protein
MHEIPLMDKDRESSTSPALTARNMNPHPSSFSPRPREYPVGGDKRLAGKRIAGKKSRVARMATPGHG